MNKPKLTIRLVERRPELPALVADSIIREVAERRLGPGDQLPTEQALATMFGVSRNVVREAMARLRSAGTIWSRQGSGFFVAEPPASLAPLRRPDPPPSAAEAFRDLFEARHALEPWIAALAAARREEADIARLGEAVSAMSAAPYGSRSWIDSDIAFHQSLAAATANRLLVQVLDAVIHRLRESLLAARVQPELATAAECTIREHQAIVCAVRAGNAPAAGEAVREHLVAAQRRLGG